MKDQYLLATFVWRCGMCESHRIIIMSDHGEVWNSACELVQQMRAFGCSVSGQHKCTVDRDLIDGMLAPELGI